jgi:tRNA U34 5-carboxymethylaminomethyl modifying enzyme MnmG/GidA
MSLLANFLVKHDRQIARLRSFERRNIPARLSFKHVPVYPREIQQTLERVRPATLSQAARIPGVTPAAVAILELYWGLPANFLTRHDRRIARPHSSGRHNIPARFRFKRILGLLCEIQQKLERVRPAALGQAARIPGMTPAAVAIRDVYLSLPANFLPQHDRRIARLRSSEQRNITASYRCRHIPGLSCEIQHQLERVRPAALGQAARIPGMTPALVPIRDAYLRLPANFLAQHDRRIAPLRSSERRNISVTSCFKHMFGLSCEIQQKLERLRPATLSQAARIPGVTPLAVAILDAYLSLLANFLAQHDRQIAPLRSSERRNILAYFRFKHILGLSCEIQNQLERVRPAALGQAARIPGVAPAAVAVPDVYLSLPGRAS